MDISQKILSDITAFSKYAKHIPEKKRRETWEEVCDRNLAMHVKKFPILADEITAIYKKYVYTRKVLPSMRSMQFAGRPAELSNNRIYNCAYLAVDSIDAFHETLFLLLGGTGIGFSVQQHHIAKLPIVVGTKKQSRRFLVGDSIEGWGDAVKVLVKAFFQGKAEPAFDFRDIRPKGALLVTSGGKAPGPDPLRICIEHIRAILHNAVGRKLTSLEIHDIMCHIADAVLSGGIRRAALISLFSPDDLDMISCKSGDWWELNPQRGRSNNSAVLHREYTTEEQFKALWERIKDSNAGEPGIFWTNDLELGTNPCCLAGDTLVQTDSGKVSIAEIVEMVSSNIPVMVRCYNIEKKEYVYRPVINGILTHKNASVIDVVIRKDNGEQSKVTCTLDHKIFTLNRSWVEASSLMTNDLLVDEDNQIARLASIVFKNEKVDVFDIEVEEHHNFLANGLLVKNCEISLRNMGFCNLTEMNVSDVETQEELNEMSKAAAFIGTLQAAYTDFHYLRPEWEENAKQEALIGVGQTGIGSGKVLSLDLAQAAKEVLLENERVARIVGINVAARSTCIKPSGCLGTQTLIKTSKGDLTLEQIFLENDFDPITCELGFLDIKEELFVYDMNNELQMVTKLFNNGKIETLNIQFDDGVEINCTRNHKFLTSNGWKRADELKEEDDIISF